MRKLLTLIAATALVVGFAGLGVNHIVHAQNKIELREVELKSTTTQLKDLQLKYEDLNRQYEKAGSDKQQLQKQKDDLEKQKQDLERQVSLKKQQQPATAVFASGGNREDWLRQAGIDPSDWPAVDTIIGGEGGWAGVTRWNTGGSGAYGLCQALPASKMASAGADYMTNPVTQLKWCDGYAKGKYGGWWAAKAFWERTDPRPYPGHWW